jgi:hypothetical protein
LDKAIAPALSALKLHAAEGVPTLAELKASFPATAQAIASASAPPPASESRPPNATIWDRVLARLSGLVTIRPVGNESGTAAPSASDEMSAHVARAQARLDAGDLPGAVKELESLPPGKAADAAKPWLERAHARLAADQALLQLQTAAADALAHPASAQ